MSKLVVCCIQCIFSCTQHEYEDCFVTDKYITSDPIPRTNPDCTPALSRQTSLLYLQAQAYALNIKDTCDMCSDAAKRTFWGERQKMKHLPCIWVCFDKSFMNSTSHRMHQNNSRRRAPKTWWCLNLAALNYAALKGLIDGGEAGKNQVPVAGLALQWMCAVRMRVNGCSAVNVCRQNEGQWMLCSECVPSEWGSMDALQWMGAVRMRVNGCSAVNGCRQTESQWMLCSEWVPSDWESMDALQWMCVVYSREEIHSSLLV